MWNKVTNIISYVSYLEAEDIEDGNGGCAVVLLPSLDDVVDTLHQPGKQAAVQSFGDGIPGEHREIQIFASH